MSLNYHHVGVDDTYMDNRSMPWVSILAFGEPILQFQAPNDQDPDHFYMDTPGPSYIIHRDELVTLADMLNILLDGPIR